MTPPQSGAAEEPLLLRLLQTVLAAVLALVSVLLMVTTHRLTLELGPLEIPAGLLFGAAFQTVASVFLLAVTGSRFPVVVLSCAWGLLVMPFAGRGAGGGVLMPAVIGDQLQLSGWILQGMGVLIPFVVVLVETIRRRRRRR